MNDLFIAQFQDTKADISAFADRLTARIDDISNKCRSVIEISFVHGNKSLFSLLLEV